MSSANYDRLGDAEAGEGEGPRDAPPVPGATRSIYSMTRKEVTRGLANRFVHSRAYVVLYLGMACLSVVTVGLSLANGCPTLPFYILELVINGAMILEVAIRFVAFGRQFWTSLWNVMDLVITAFCVITLLVIFFAGCGSTSKEEELFDTILLVARNAIQFGRLAIVMRQSGHSIFSQPKPIDLAAARGTYTLDIDLEDDEPFSDELGRPLIHNSVVFDAGEERPAQPRAPLSEMPRAVQAARERDDEDLWAELG